MHTFKTGDRVAVLNQKLSGEFFVEGYAKVRCIRRDVDEQYSVTFEGSKARYDRFVDPSAQTDPQAYAQELNSRIGRGAP